MNQKYILKLAMFGFMTNVVLTLLKLIVGYIGNSQALVSDGFNSLSDIGISVVMMISLKISSKKADKDHHYGHEKFEGIGFFLVGIIFFLTAILLGYGSVTKAISIYNNESVTYPKSLALYATIIALVIKIGLFTFFYRGYKKYQVLSFKADALNHLFDILATSLVLISIVLSKYFSLYFDSIGSFIIAVFILIMALKMIKDAVLFLVDTAPSEAIIKEIKQTILFFENVLSVDDLKVRMHMTKLYVDVEIGLKGNMSLKEAHEIAESVHIGIEKAFPNVKHCMVHVNPHK